MIFRSLEGQIGEQCEPSELSKLNTSYLTAKKSYKQIVL